MLSNQAEIELVNLLRRGERTVVESNDHLLRLGLTNFKMVQSRGKINQLYSKQNNERRFSTLSNIVLQNQVFFIWLSFSHLEEYFKTHQTFNLMTVTDYLESSLTHKNHSSMNSF